MSKENKHSDEVLVLFSGRKNPFYLNVLMLDMGYIVKIVFFENRCGLKAYNAIETAKRII